MQDESLGKDIVRFQNRRIITGLFKDFLCLLEDVDIDMSIALDNLKKEHPELSKEIDMANHFTEQKWDTLRSRILGRGNDSIRELDSNLEFFDIKIKNKE